MSLISRLGVVLGLDSAEFSAGLGKAEGDLKKFNTSAGGTGIALTALAGAFTATAVSAIQYADQINDISLANDASVSSILEFSQALSSNGGKLEDVGKIYSQFTRKLDEAKTTSQDLRKTFGELGISEKDLANLSQEKIFEKTIAALGEMKDVGHRNALMFELLGKSMKLVDAQGMAQDFAKVQGTMSGMDEKFRSVGKGVDAWGRIVAKVKQDVVKDFGGMFESISLGFENFLTYMDTKYIPDTMVIVNKWRKAWNLGGDVTVKAPVMKFEKNFGLTGESWEDSPSKVLPKTKEQISAQDKIAKAAEKVRDAMLQQSLEYQKQIDLAGKQESILYKTMLEFAKGGKYAGQENTALGTKLINQAIAIDQKKIEVDLQKSLYDYQVAEAKELGRKIKAGEDIVKAVTERRQAEKETFDLATQDIQVAIERLQYEKQLAGLADSQRQKALDFFDISRRTKRMAETNVGLSSGELETRQKSEQDFAFAKEENARAQKTFQAGWGRAYNNFVETASDSAALGAQAFNSMSSNMSSAIDSFTRTGKLSFGDFARSIILDVAAMILKMQMLKLVMSIIGFAGGGASKGTSGNSGVTDLYQAGVGTAAEGGNIDGPTIVGERGMELFIPQSPGTVIPNNALASMMGNQPQVVYNGPYIANLSTIDSKSFEQRIYQSSSAVWAANAYANKSMPTTGGRT